MRRSPRTALVQRGLSWSSRRSSLRPLSRFEYLQRNVQRLHNATRLCDFKTVFHLE